AWFERVNKTARYLFIHESYIHHMQSTPLFGAVIGYSLQHNRVRFSSQSHLQYVAARQAVVRKNTMNSSGVSYPQHWYQCGIRFNSFHRNWTDAPLPGQILIQDNNIYDT